MSTRVLVLSEDHVGAEMGGNAIRAYELAGALRAYADVTLAAPGSGDAPSGVARVAIGDRSPRALDALFAGFEVIVALPPNAVVGAALRRSGARVVYDLYDPKLLQLIEAHADARPAVRRYWSTIARDHLLEALTTGDFLMCAGDRQRDLWIGALLACGAITPSLYDEDPALRRLIDTVPFGIGAEPPKPGAGARARFPAISSADEVVLWNGGLWSWLDPECAVRAIALAHSRRPSLRLVFMGRSTPGADASAKRARDLAGQMGLLDRVVFFNDEWVPYERRGGWLLDAECALSLHLEHLETRYAFRTRLLDCFWAGLPVVCTGGDELADFVARDALGAVVPAGDPNIVASSLLELLDGPRDSYASHFARVRSELSWSSVVEPLGAYLSNPLPRPGRRSRSLPRTARAMAVRALRAAGRRY